MLRLVLVATLLIAGQVSAQNFSCGYGKRASCLDYSDTVCSGLGKCVASTSSCFDSYQCDYEGFACKSSVTSCVEDYDDLVGKYNSLLSANGDLVDRYNSLLSDYDDLLRKAKTLANSLDSIKGCLVYADDLDEAQACEWY